MPQSASSERRSIASSVEEHSATVVMPGPGGASVHLLPEDGKELGLADPHLLHRVALAQRERAVLLDGIEVDRDAPGRPDLVLPPVAPAYRARLVVKDR